MRSGKKNAIAIRTLVSRLLASALFVYAGSGITHAEDIRALLMAGFTDDCSVITVQGKTLKPKPMMGLFAGDKVSQLTGTDALRIKCAPFTQAVKRDPRTIEIVYTPPAENHSVFKELQSFLGFEQEKHERKIAGARDLQEMLAQIAEIITPQPGNKATALSGYPVRFCWRKKGDKVITFKGAGGNEILSRPIPAKGPCIELTPEEIGLKAGEHYYWEISVMGMPRNSESFVISRAEEKLDAIIRNDISKIQSGDKGLAGDLAAAAYCQFISDTFAGKIDLYWLSSQFLARMESGALSESDSRRLRMLAQRYLQHLQAQAASEST